MNRGNHAGKKEEQIKQQIKRQILAYAEEMQAEMNRRLLEDNLILLGEELSLQERILWVENITVTAIIWQTHTSKVSQFLAGIKGIMSDIRKWLDKHIHRFL